jgi:hypothetical protein
MQLNYILTEFRLSFILKMEQCIFMLYRNDIVEGSYEKVNRTNFLKQK